MYVAAIRLRYTQPEKARPFRIPGGNFGMWIVGTIGLLGALTALVFSFIPPNQISTGSPIVYVGILVVGCAVFAAIPFLFFAFHKPGWKAPDSDFEPFQWQVEGRLPNQTPGGSRLPLPLKPALARRA